MRVSPLSANLDFETSHVGWDVLGDGEGKQEDGVD